MAKGNASAYKKLLDKQYKDLMNRCQVHIEQIEKDLPKPKEDLAELMNELPEAVFLCIVSQEYGDMNLEMTPLMREKFPAMEKLLQDELARLNMKLERVVNA